MTSNRVKCPGSEFAQSITQVGGTLLPHPDVSLHGEGTPVTFRIPLQPFISLPQGGGMA